MSQTDASPGLADRALAASGWRFGTVAVQVVLQLVVLAVLSRLLPPADFGVLGIAMIFVNLATVIADLGAGAALIQRRDVSDLHIRSTLTLSFSMGLVLALVLGFGAPWWAALFRSPRVEPILRLLSVSFLLNAGALVPGALIWRRMHMRALGIAEICSYGVGYGIVGILLAVQGQGIWALAWAVIVQSSLRAILLFKLARLSPIPGLGRRELREVLGFGLGVSLTKLFNFAATKGDYVIVGRWLGGEALGLYERAYRLMEMPATYVAGVVARLLFPALSEIQDDEPRLQRGFRAALMAVVLIYAPAAVALWVTAPHLIRALFGDQWIGAVAPLQILSLGLLFRGAHKICDSAVRAKGAVYQSAWRVFVYAVLVLVGAIIGYRWGLSGVALGVTAAIGCRYALAAGLTIQLLKLGWRGFFQCHGPGVALAAALGCVLFPVEAILTNLGLGPWFQLILLAATTTVTALLGLLVMPSSWLGRDLSELTARLVRRLPGAGPRMERWLCNR